MLANGSSMHADEHRHHDSEHEHDGDDKNIVLAKSMAMVVLCLASLLLGLAPIQLARWYKWRSNLRHNSYVRLALSFGGGVLLCTTFQHLLPEIGENVAELQEDGTLPKLRFNLPEFLMCVGFFTIFLVEELVHTYAVGRKSPVKGMSALSRSYSLRKGKESDAGVNVAMSAQIVKSPSASSLPQTVSEMCAGHSHTHIIPDDGAVSSLRGLMIVLALSIHELFEGLAVGLETTTSAVWYMLGAVSAHKLVIAFCIGVELVMAGTKTFFSVLYIALFAVVSPIGIGVGIAVSSNADASAVPSVILQGLASGTLLYVIFFEVLDRQRVAGLKHFSSIVLGYGIMFGLHLLRIGIGIALCAGEETGESLVSSVLQGMAAGTLLYVVFFEVLARERSNRHSGLWQLLAIMAGFSVMFTLQYLTGHEHSHSHEEHGDEKVH